MGNLAVSLVLVKESFFSLCLGCDALASKSRPQCHPPELQLVGVQYMTSAIGPLGPGDAVIYSSNVDVR